jgi:hypothetical protein
MRPINRIVTRGMGSSRGLAGRAGLVTQGYGGPLHEVLRRIVRIGQSGAKRALRELDEVIVWAKMIRLNDEPPPAKVEGFVRVRVNRASSYAVSLIEHVSTRVRKAWEDIRISIKRLK